MVIGGVLQLKYIEVKTTLGSKAPTTAQLTDNQAVFVDALLNGRVDSVTSTSPGFAALLDAFPGAASAVIVEFEFAPTLLY